MIRLRFLLTLVFLSFALGHLSYADTLHLKSGDSFDGEVVSEDANGVMFAIDGGAIKFTHAEIDKIDKNQKEKIQKKKAQKQSVESTSIEEVHHESKETKNIFKSFLSSFSAWKEIDLPFQKKEKYPRRPSKQKKEINLMFFVFMHALISFLLQGLTMKLYFGIFQDDQSYFYLLWFQIKILLTGFLVCVVLGFTVGFTMALISGGQTTSTRFWGFGVGLVGYAINYYIRAKRDLEAGLLKAFGLSWVMVFTNVGAWKLMEKIGFQNYGATFWSQFVS